MGSRVGKKEEKEWWEEGKEDENLIVVVGRSGGIQEGEGTVGIKTGLEEFVSMYFLFMESEDEMDNILSWRKRTKAVLILVIDKTERIEEGMDGKEKNMEYKITQSLLISLKSYYTIQKKLRGGRNRWG